MTDDQRYQLLYGTYKTPACQLGKLLFCELRGWVKVRRLSDGPIPWPQTVVKRSRALILCGDLVKAVQRESEIAVAHWPAVSRRRNVEVAYPECRASAFPLHPPTQGP